MDADKCIHGLYSPAIRNSMHALRTDMGPAKSTPVYVKAGSSLTLNLGRGGGGGPRNGAPSYLLQVVHLCTRDLVRVKPLMTQYQL